MKAIASILSLFSLALCLILFYQNSTLKKEIATLKDNNEIKSALQTQDEEEVHVGEYMQKFQYFSTKLYFAGASDNKDLQKFYIHELEEYMEELVEKGVYEDGINISENIEQYGIKSLETFEKKLAMGNDFEESFSNLINGCNSCHKVSKHPFVQISIPKENPFNQQF